MYRIKRYIITYFIFFIVAKVTQGDDSRSKEREDVDELVSSLLGPTNPPVAEQPSTKLSTPTVPTETAGDAHVIPKKKLVCKCIT